MIQKILHFFLSVFFFFPACLTSYEHTINCPIIQALIGKKKYIWNIKKKLPKLLFYLQNTCIACMTFQDKVSI